MRSSASASAFANYPTTIGAPALREAIAGWLARRHGLAALDPATQVLPVLGSREALFAFGADRARRIAARRDRRGAESVLSDLRRRGAAGGRAHPLRQRRSRARLRARLRERARRRVGAHAVAVRVLARQPDRARARPGGDWRELFALSDRHGFVDRLRRVLLGDLFRRSDAAARRARRGASAKDATAFRGWSSSAACRSAPTRPACARAMSRATRRYLKAFLLYRTYHGSAMSGAVAAASVAAWNDEAHVRANRAEYAAKFARLQPRGRVGAAVRNAGGRVLPVGADARSTTPSSRGASCTRRTSPCCRAAFVARDANGINPGSGRIRLALVATQAECAEAVERLVAFARRLTEARRDRPSRADARFVAAGQRPVADCAGACPPLRLQCRRMNVRASHVRLRGHAGRRLQVQRGARSCCSPRSTPGIAAVLWIDDARPFWHPLLTVQLYGFSIAYCVNAAAPWAKPRPDPAARRSRWRSARCIGLVLTILVKGLLAGLRREPAVDVRLQRVRGLRQRPVRQPVLLRQVSRVAGGGSAAQGRGRAAPAVEAGDRGGAEAHAGAGRAALPVQHARVGAIPHRDRSRGGESPARPPDRVPARGAAALAGELDDAAARRSGLAEAYLNILRMRMGARLAFAIDVPGELAIASVPAEPADLARRERDQARHRACARAAAR